MTESRRHLRELDEAISRGSGESRLRALWHATDLLIAGRYSEADIWVFGEVIGRLTDEIAEAARARLATKLAASDQAPTAVVNKLARDSSIDVAGPVLRRSERIDVRTLVDIASTRSQQHLLAISKRRSISEEVTDVLVTRGDQEVVRSVAQNHGARFSDYGLMQMIRRSETDSILAEHLGFRRDIPRHVFQQLIAKASDLAGQKIASQRPDLANHAQTAVTQATGAMHAKFGPATQKYFAAKKAVTSLHQFGALREEEILKFAHARQFEEAIVALSLLSALPVDVVERALIHTDGEMTLVLCKALELSWNTTMALLFLGAPDYRISSQDLDAMMADFENLNVAASRDILAFYKSRKASAADQRRLSQRAG